MKIHASTLGPIVGHTTHESCRLWVRGHLELTSPDAHRRCFVVARARRAGGQWGPAVYAKSQPKHDMGGVCILQGLAADSAHEYQGGWFFSDAELEDLDPAAAHDWSAVPAATFRTGTTDPQAARSYVIGSCRYLVRVLGGGYVDETGDKVFRRALEQLDAGRRIDGLVMTGDQIYADAQWISSPACTLEEYFDCYRTAFGQPKLRELMSRVPTYMTLDDHEIKNDWPRSARDDDRVKRYVNAMFAYQAYQASHSPLFEVEGGRITGTPRKYWYRFSDGCADWFVTDTRTERAWDEDEPAKRAIMSDEQMQALKAWLADGSGRAKIVVSAVPVFPDLKREKDDKWQGFLRQRDELLEWIFGRGIPKVVFASGDVHCSFSCELLAAHAPAKVIAVVSSAFYWPLPGLGENSFRWTGDLETLSTRKYVIGNRSAVHAVENFGRLGVDPAGVTVEYFNRQGASLGAKRHAF